MSHQSYFKLYNECFYRFIDRASGAYIFRPLHQEPEPLGDPVQSSLVRGDLVQEAHLRYNGWISQVIRLYKGQDTVEFEWLVGPLPDQERGTPGVEVITRYTADIQSGDKFRWRMNCYSNNDIL